VGIGFRLQFSRTAAPAFIVMDPHVAEATAEALFHLGANVRLQRSTRAQRLSDRLVGERSRLRMIWIAAAAGVLLIAVRARMRRTLGVA
jgi:hypothetical protein